MYTVENFAPLRTPDNVQCQLTRGGGRHFLWNIFFEGLTLSFGIIFRTLFRNPNFFGIFLRKTFEITLFQLYGIGGAETFFEDENGGGGNDFFQSWIGG